MVLFETNDNRLVYVFCGLCKEWVYKKTGNKKFYDGYFFVFSEELKQIGFPEEELFLYQSWWLEKCHKEQIKRYGLKFIAKFDDASSIMLEKLFKSYVNKKAWK